jgi:hypothetical protein
MLSAVGERDLRAGDQIVDGSRHEDLPRASERRDASGDVDGYARDVIATAIAFSGVETGADVESEPCQLAQNRCCAPDRASRTVEHGEQPVAGALDPTSSKPLEFSIASAVVAIE